MAKIELSKEQTELFNSFWKEYPKRNGLKQGKFVARKAWLKLNPSIELFDKIMDGLKFLKTTKDWLKDNGQYIPMASTFLNQSRWEVGTESEEINTEQNTNSETTERIACKSVPTSGSLRQKYIENAGIIVGE